MRVGTYRGMEHGETDYAGHGVGFWVGRVFVDECVLSYEVVVGLNCCLWETWHAVSIDGNSALLLD